MRTALIIAALIALAAPAQADVGDHQLYVYGDSLAIGTEPYLPAELPDWHVRQNDDYARRTSDAPPALRALGDQLAPVVHISLGTVDNPHRPGRFRHQVRRTLRAAGADRCIVWANIYRPLRRPDGSIIVNGFWRLNRVLDDEAARRENLIVVKWAGMVRRHLDWRSEYDGTHVNQRGYRARARAVADAVRACPS